MTRKLLAEAAGTFALVFAGTGAVVVNDATGGAVTHAGVSLAFGGIVAAMICFLGNVSGAHINPAVTLGFVASRRLPAREAGPYVAAQCAGAVAASFLLRLLAPAHPHLGATLPAGSLAASFALEVGLTLGLMFVILGVSTGPLLRTALAVGAVVGLASLLAGPISGASMNPARSLGPALASGRLEPLWIYLTAPFAGALLAVPLCRATRGAGCCVAAQPCGEP